MKRFFVGTFTFMLGFIFIFISVQLVNAQEKSDYEFTLEEITVTAQKREENQQKVAMAMEVVSGDDLRVFGKNDIDDILNNISTVLIQSNTDGLRVSLRGVSNDNSPFLNTQASTPTVAVNMDGVYTNRNSGNQGLYDIERVEVLFGPQSTMYASGSPGGIVNVVTADPKTDQYEASGTLEYGNYNYLHTAGSMNAPLSDTMALRAAFTTSVHDGYLTNGSMDEDIKSARLKALYQPGDRFSIILTGEITMTGGQGFAGVAAFENQDDTDDPWTSDDENAGMGRDQVQKKITARMDADLGVGTLSLIPSYSKTTNYSQGTTTGMGGSTYLSTRENDGYEKGVEARIASSEDFPFKWIIGANLYKSNDAMYQVSVNQTVEENDQVSDVWNKQESKAIYGNITYPVTDRWRATAGARQTWDKNKTSSHQIPCRTSPTLAECTSCTTMEYDSPNFKLGIEYDIAENSMFYADWSSSYRMNGSGILPSGVDAIDPEELYAYTAGAKNRFFGNKLQLNVSAYYYDYQNYYANMGPTMIPVDLDGDNEWDPATETDITSAVNIRTGDAEVYGFDIQSSTIISANDKLDLSVSYVKKKFTKLFFDFPEMLNYFGIEDLDYSGREMPQSPNWNATATYNHNFHLSNGGSITASLEARYTSKYVLNWVAKELSLTLVEDDDGNYTGEYVAEVTDTSNVRWQEAYYIGDISLGYTNSDGKWTLTGYVKNITNYAVKNFLDGMGNLMIGDPRTYGAVLSINF